MDSDDDDNIWYRHSYAKAVGAIACGYQTKTDMGNENFGNSPPKPLRLPMVVPEGTSSSYLPNLVRAGLLMEPHHQQRKAYVYDVRYEGFERRLIELTLLDIERNEESIFEAQEAGCKQHDLLEIRISGDLLDILKQNLKNLEELKGHFSKMRDNLHKLSLLESGIICGSFQSIFRNFEFAADSKATKLKHQQERRDQFKKERAKVLKDLKENQDKEHASEHDKKLQEKRIKKLHNNRIRRLKKLFKDEGFCLHNVIMAFIDVVRTGTIYFELAPTGVPSIKGFGVQAGHAKIDARFPFLYLLMKYWRETSLTLTYYLPVPEKKEVAEAEEKEYLDLMSKMMAELDKNN